MAQEDGARKAKRTEVNADAARRTLGDLLDRVGFLGERIVITRQYKGGVAALVSMDDLKKLEGAA